MSNEPTGYVPPPEAAGLTGLGGLDPRELLKGGLNSIPKQSKWTPPEPAKLAALLPKYEIEALIGHGGMGAVYKGRQPDLDRAVAIKLLPAELTVDGDFVERFKREAKMLAKLQHPGIVAVFETRQTSAGHLYFVMEFVDGTDLAQVIHGVGLQPVRALEIGTQICDALNYAHKHGVIHRDIKPANVLLNREGRAKLADFGLAKPEESGIGANLTAPQVIMGTPSYMAPEAKAGKSDERSDIFSLGVMLYEMLTGQTPAGVFSPASQRGQVDIRIDDVVLKAMQQQPERRYQQASEFKTDVDTIRVGPAPVVKKSRLPVWLGIAAVVGLGGFFWWGKMNGKPAVEQPVAAATAKPAATSAEALPKAGMVAPVPVTAPKSVIGTAAPVTGEDGFASLFNGKDLAGWKASADARETFSVKDGAIIGKGGRAHLYYDGAGAPFTDFVLRFEVMSEKEANGGVFFHAKYQAAGAPLPSPEFQIASGHSVESRATGSLYKTKDLTTSPVANDEWFQGEITVQRGQITFRINGKVVNEAPSSSKEGTFALQAWSNGAVGYRSLRVKKL